MKTEDREPQSDLACHFSSRGILITPSQVLHVISLFISVLFCHIVERGWGVR